MNLPPNIQGVYFYIPDAPLSLREHHPAACLMDGLAELGVPVFSNTPHPVATVRSLGDMGAFLYVFVFTEQSYSPELCDAVAAFAAPHKVILSMADTVSDWLLPDTVPALLTHQSTLRVMTGWRLPWGIGYSRSTAAATAETPDFASRKPVLLRNFRPTPNQHVRNAIDVGFADWFAAHFEVDREISGNHFGRLLGSQACAAYGGMFMENLMSNVHFAEMNDVQLLHANIRFLRETCVVRWDSWRFYESLAAGCLTLQLDLEKYGLPLPVMPVPWQHYIPLRFDDPKGCVEEMIRRREEWPAIAAAGRDWVREHYSPVACARRLLDYAERGFRL
jgi:hypothetical protein